MLKFEKNKRQGANGTSGSNTPDLPEEMPEDKAGTADRMSIEQLSGVTGGARPGNPEPPH